MAPSPAPWQLGQDLARCAALGAVSGAARALLPVRGRAAVLPDLAWVGALLAALQSYAAGASAARSLRWYMLAGGAAAALAAQALGSVLVRRFAAALARAAAVPARFLAQTLLRPALAAHKKGVLRAKERRSAKITAKMQKKSLQKQRRLLYNSNVST